MPINPNIALNVRPVELPDPLNAFAKYSAIQNAQNQNALAQYQLSQAQRQDAAANAQNEAWRGAVKPDGSIDYSALTGALARGGAGSAIPGVLKQQLDTQAKQADLAKTQAETASSTFKLKKDQLDTAIRHVAQFTDPQDVLIDLRNKVAAGELSNEAAVAVARSLPDSVEGMAAWRQQKLRGLLTAAEQLEQHFSQVDTGQQIATVAAPKYGGGAASVVPGTTFQKQMTPGEVASNAVAKGNLAVAQENLAETKRQHAWERNKPVWDDTAGGYRFPPSSGNPTGSFLAAPEVNRSKEQQNAISALRTAGYDPETGEDRIEQLIRKSTSGRLESFSAEAAAWLGNTTEGRKAIGALATRANKIALDMLGGKLGAQISNTDREFIVQTLGDVANDKLPAEQRLASWQEAKNRMMTSGVIPPPKQGRTVGGKITNVSPPPAGISQAEWNVMTPEEKALWTKQP